MRDNPKYSILIPVYNVSEYLEDCFNSIVDQKKIQDYEVIIVDDGSTDKSGAICDAYSKRDSRFKVYHNTNHGQLYSRCFAINKAKGEFVIFLDSDDSLETNALQKIDDTFSKYDCDCVIYGLKQVCNNKIIYTNTEEKTNYLNDKKEIFKKYFITDKYNNIWRKAVKRKVLDGRDYNDFYHLKMSEDLLQSVEIIENAESIVFLEDILYIYRVNPKSITQTIDYKKFNADYSIREYVLNRLKHWNLFDDNDWEKYRDMCLSSICIEIAGIAGASISRNNKKELFHRIKKTYYYKEFLSKGEFNSSNIKQKIVWDLFKKGYYEILILLYEIIRRGKK